MITFESDFESVISELTEASEIVDQDVENYERNQRLLQYGLLPSIEEERQIDFMESIRNCNNSDRDRLDDDFDNNIIKYDRPKIWEKLKHSKCCDFFACTKNKKIGLFLITIILIAVNTFGYLWITKYKNNLFEYDITTVSSTTSDGSKNTSQNRETTKTTQGKVLRF